ncbi:hypothetical protein CBS101457_001350 [Exobasidium rhododendri]|nr:hypothetical protein CBS101457_001350 [Exobasidium rhododendri]
MGLLSLGTPLPWPEAKPLADHVREHGITQFLSLWSKIKDRRGDKLLWGDEIEYIVIAFDEKGQNAKLSLRQEEILLVLAKSHEQTTSEAPEILDEIPTFHPEYGRFMLESTPGRPYGCSPKELRLVEANMRLRRKIARSHLKDNELPITLTSYARLGCNDVPFTDPHLEPNGTSSRSMFLPDEIINPHVRFPTLTANIRMRRAAKVAINVPIFHDTNTPRPFIDPTIPHNRNIFPEDKEAGNGAALPDHIYMDAMGFGMGCCCLQVTFQACSVAEARTVYDHLVPVAPLMLALTAASPAYRGYLADVDCRWNVISAAVDDRTREEKGLEPLKNSRMKMPKSRYDSVDSYISNDPLLRPEYNDNPLPVDEGVKARLEKSGIDPLLANHLAHLFIRDPLVIFSEMIEQDDEVSMDHFENLQSTNWQTLRFKPPPPGGQIGWRVEFRSMEVQITDFENAAYSVFIALLTRAILSFGLNFYIPISKVDENMKRAHNRDAVLNEKFFFRKDVYRTKPRHHAREASARNRSMTPMGSKVNSRATSPIRHSTAANHAISPSPRRISRAPSPELGPVEDEYDEYTLDELINGAGTSTEDGSEGFPGLITLINNYLDSLNVDVETRCQLGLYLDLISSRANGSLMTTASWMRKFIRSHPDYKQDSVVSAKINYDMIKTLDDIERGVVEAPGFLPSHYAKRRRESETQH